MNPRTHRPLTVLALVLGLSMAALEATVVATAMPTVVADLGGIGLYGWVSAAYLLASTVTVPLFGKLADLHGRKPVMLAGIALFLLGSAASGASGSIHQLIAFRALQGVGAGAMGPMALTIVGDLFDVEARGRIQGLFGSVWGVSGIVGPLVGGLIVRALSWRWVFYVNLPGGLAAMAVLALAFHEDVQRREHRIDWPGAVTVTLASLALLLGASGGRASWLLAPGAALVALFVWLEARAQEPLLPLGLFRQRVIAVASAASALMGGVMFVTITYVPLYVQGVQGATPTQAGTAIAPMLVGWPLASALSGRYLTRTGFRAPIRAGGAVTALAAATVAWLVAHGGPGVPLRVAMGAFGVGLGLINTASLIAVQSSVGWAQRGVATASTMFFRTMGGALFVGALGSLLAARLARAVAPDVVSRLLASGHGGARATDLGPVAGVLSGALSEVLLVGAGLAALLAVATFLFPAAPLRASALPAAPAPATE